MKINKNNYEAFFLDYYEGRLSPNEVAELLLFVEQHPELRSEFESFENITLDELEISFKDKSSLKKEVTVNNKDEYFIKAVEQTITPAEIEMLNAFLKQHPQSYYELELYKKTKLQPDPSVVFQEKDELKHVCSPLDELLITSIEGGLTPSEKQMLQQQIAVDAFLSKEYELFERTRSIVDHTVVFENKEQLKRKEPKVIALYYRVAVAAAILLLFGLFFLFNNKGVETEYANNNGSTVHPSDNTKNEKSNVFQQKDLNSSSSLATNKKGSKNVVRVKKHNGHSSSSPSSIFPDKINNGNMKKDEILVAENKQEEKQNIVSKKDEPVLLADNSVNKMNQKSSEGAKKEDYLSLKEMAVERIKEKTLPEEELEKQKRSGRFKRFSLWDAAQAVANGISKVTGKQLLTVQSEYNEQGDVTAYALGAGGFEISRGR